MNILFIFKRYIFSIIFSFILIILYLHDNDFGFVVYNNTASSIIQMIQVLPPIMIILSLIDIWISRESMVKYMGENSGISGIFLSISIAALSAGPMYAAFPFAAVLSKKGVKLSNIMIFLNAWCVIKISTLLFEISNLGYEFTLTRLLINLPGVILMGYLIEYLLNKNIFPTIVSKKK